MRDRLLITAEVRETGAPRPIASCLQTLRRSLLTVETAIITRHRSGKRFSFPSISNLSLSLLFSLFLFNVDPRNNRVIIKGETSSTRFSASIAFRRLAGEKQSPCYSYFSQIRVIQEHEWCSPAKGTKRIEQLGSEISCRSANSSGQKVSIV